MIKKNNLIIILHSAECFSHKFTYCDIFYTYCGFYLPAYLLLQTHWQFGQGDPNWRDKYFKTTKDRILVGKAWNNLHPSLVIIVLRSLYSMPNYMEYKIRILIKVFYIWVCDIPLFLYNNYNLKKTCKTMSIIK